MPLVSEGVEERLHCFLDAKSLRLVQKISKGFSGDVFEVRDSGGEHFALKIEHAKSRRNNMILKERLFLEKANSIGVGPVLVSFDLDKRVVLMEFVGGEPFGKWVFGKVSKTDLKKVVSSLLLQARKLDSIGLDHGQLAGKGKNILIPKNLKPVIIDFEKGSLGRKAHNVSQLESFLFYNPHSAISKKVRNVLGNARTEKESKGVSKKAKHLIAQTGIGFEAMQKRKWR